MHFGDRLVQGHVIALNPFATVRSQKHHTDGKTPETTVQQARELLASIYISTVVGLRDRPSSGRWSTPGHASARWRGCAAATSRIREPRVLLVPGEAR